MKIKKYTIDEEIPDSVKASDLLKIEIEEIFRKINIPNSEAKRQITEKVEYFYFLVKEEKEKTEQISCPYHTLCKSCIDKIK